MPATLPLETNEEEMARLMHSFFEKYGVFHS